MSTTLTNLRTIAYDILREEEDTSAYPYTLMDLMINSAQQRICAGKVRNPLTREEIRKGELPFLQTDKFYSNVQPTSLSSDASVGATTLTVASTADFPSSGTLYIAGNIITYTGTTSTTFTGCSGVLFAFESGMEVSIAFTLPDDYMSPIEVRYNNKFKLAQKAYKDLFEDLNRYKGTNYSRNRSIGLYDTPYKINPFYTIINGAYLVFFGLNNNDDIIHLRYEKAPTEMTTTSSTATIDNDIYAKSTIAYLAVGEMLFNRGEESRAAEILNFAIGQVKEMYSFYNNKTYESISGVQYRTAKGTLNI